MSMLETQQIALKVSDRIPPLTQSIIDITPNTTIKLGKFELRLFRSILQERLEYIGKGNIELTLEENSVQQEELTQAIEEAKQYMNLYNIAVDRNQIPQPDFPPAPKNGF